MLGLLALILIVGLFLYLIWYLFFRSLLWVAEPLVEYFDNRDAEKFVIEDIDKDKFNGSNLEGITKRKVKVSIKDFAKPIHLSKSLLQKAQKEPQKLGDINLWIYKDYIFRSKPTEAKLKKMFDKQE